VIEKNEITLKIMTGPLDFKYAADLGKILNFPVIHILCRLNFFDIQRQIFYTPNPLHGFLRLYETGTGARSNESGAGQVDNKILRFRHCMKN
jgi:hypothetical protein